MQDLLLTGVVVLAFATVLNLALTLRLLGYARARGDERTRALRQRPELVVGSIAPEFVATSLDGRQVQRSDFAGEPALFLFLSPECSLCRAELPELMRLSRTMRRRRTAMALVSQGSVEDTKAWLEDIRERDHVTVDVPVLLAEASALEEYNPTLGTPYFCLLDAQGVVQARSLCVLPEWQRVKRDLEGATSIPSWMT